MGRFDDRSDFAGRPRLAGIPGAGSADAAGWIADAQTGCRVWSAQPEPTESVSWSGSCANGLAQGQGTLQWFKNGKPNGHSMGEFRDGGNPDPVAMPNPRLRSVSLNRRSTT